MDIGRKSSRGEEWFYVRKSLIWIYKSGNRESKGGGALKKQERTKEKKKKKRRSLSKMKITYVEWIACELSSQGEPKLKTSPSVLLPDLCTWIFQSSFVFFLLAKLSPCFSPIALSFFCFFVFWVVLSFNFFYSFIALQQTVYLFN